MHKRIFLAALVAAAAVVCPSPARATLSSTTNTVTYTGNGATKAFTVTYKFLSSSHLVVTVAGVTKTLGSDYTIAGAGNSTGTVTFTTAPANAAAVVITRVVPYTQLRSIRNSRTYDPGTLEDMSDQQAMAEQQLQALYTNPPATVLPSNVVARLNDIFYADQYANIQTAITAAGSTGAVLIPSTYAGSDTFTNPNNIPIIDLRGGTKRWRGSVSVMDFGAKGDCSNDDAPAFNSALAVGKYVLVPDPATCYKLTSTIAIPADTWLVGVNKRSTKLQHTFNGDMFTMADGAGLSNLYLEGQGGTFTGRALVISGTDGRQTGTHLRMLSFDGAVIDFTATTAGSQSTWDDIEMTRTAATTGTGRYAVTIQDAVQLAAFPRKFSKIETSGNCSFSFGGSNNTQIENSVLGDLAFSTNSRGVKITSTRILNQVALTVDGHNNAIVGCDVFPAVTIAAGSDHIVIGPNSQNTNAIVDNSATYNGTLVSSAPTTYTPTWTASAVNPALGNGTLRGEYTRNGAQIHVSVELTVGTTTTMGTGQWRFSLPVTPPGQTGSPATQLGSGYALQNGTSTYEFVVPVVVNATSYVFLQRAGAGGPNVTNAAPFAWANGDIVRFTVDYHL